MTIDSPDSEGINFYVDSTPIYTRIFPLPATGKPYGGAYWGSTYGNLCKNSPWVTSATGISMASNSNFNSYPDFVDYKFPTHTASSFDFRMELNGLVQGVSDESQIMRDFRIYINQCHVTCASCDGDSANSCLSCPAGANYNPVSKSCICNSGLSHHLHTCIAACPLATATDPDYVLDTATNICVSKCTTCPTTCAADGLSCTSCSGANPL
jgi:hypothetical protein